VILFQSRISIWFLFTTSNFLLIFSIWWDIVLTVSFSSLVMISFSSLNIFQIVYLKDSSTHTNIRDYSGTVYIYYYFLAQGHTFLFVCISFCCCWKLDILNQMTTVEFRFFSFLRVCCCSFVVVVVFVHLVSFLKLYCKVCILYHVRSMKSLFCYVSNQLVIGQWFPYMSGTKKKIS